MMAYMTAETFWVALGFLGQFCFASRFLIQWIVSEKNKKVSVPVSFWYCSLAGGVVLFIYACYRQDPVFILGQSMGLFVYARNLMIHRNECVG